MARKTPVTAWVLCATIEGMAPPHRLIDVGGIDTFLYDTGGDGTPVVCVHGNPDCADMWLPLLEQEAGPARRIAVDLPGFGRSGRPGSALFDGGLGAHARWFALLIDTLGIERYHLAVHDWGSVGLAGALQRPEQVERLVAIDIVPLRAGYRWHWIARYLWRPPVVGEIGMPLLGRWSVKTLTRLQRPGLQPLPDEWLDRVGEHLDGGMRDAILRLYRSADPGVLGAAGADLGKLTGPALILWGEQDPYVGVAEAQRLADDLGGPAEVATFPAGHWLTVDRPEVFERIGTFLAG